MSKQSLYSDSVPTTNSSAVKFGLFVKTREMKQIEATLRQIMLMSQVDRNEWIELHQEMINELMEDFVSDSSMALDGLQLDPEATELSIEYVTTLRDVMTTLRSIMDDSRTLNS